MATKKLAKSDKETADKPVLIKRVAKIEEDRYYRLKNIAVRIFGDIADKISPSFKRLQKSLPTSNIRILLRTYVSLMLIVSSISTIVSAFIIAAVGTFLQLPFLTNIFLIICGSLAIGSTAFVLSYSYPFIETSRRRADIDANLPFAIVHMSSVAGSGAPPHTMFKVLSRFKEYGEISKEAAKISRNIEFFGLDEITAIKDVMAKTPSHQFKDVLTGILTTIQTGGNMKSYMQEQATKSMFEYRLNREQYSQTLATYADIYTAVLIAAPLLFIVILSILSVIGGQLFGMPIDMLINVGIFVLIPLLNVLFLVFIHMTQPKM